MKWLITLSLFSPSNGCQQVSKQLSEEYEKLVNPEKAAEDTKPVKIKEEPVSDITFPMSEELEGDLASGDQSLPVGVLGAQSERFSANLETEASPQASGMYSLGKHLELQKETRNPVRASSVLVVIVLSYDWTGFKCPLCDKAHWVPLGQ